MILELEESAGKAPPLVHVPCPGVCQSNTRGASDGCFPPSMLVQYPRTCFLNARGVLRGVLPRRRESILCSCLLDVDDQITLTWPMYHLASIEQRITYRLQARALHIQ